MSFDAWLAFCLTETVLCFSPGPAVLLVASLALGGGMRSGLGAALGIVSANTIYFALSATGVAVALVASREVFLVLKGLGAAYLVWLGLRLLFGARGEAPVVRPVALARSFLRGFVVQGANPKVLVFFLALLPQFLDPAASLAPQVLVLGISSVVIELLALAFYAGVAARAGRLAGPAVADALRRIGGGFLVAAGARLAAARAD